MSKSKFFQHIVLFAGVVCFSLVNCRPGNFIFEIIFFAAAVAVGGRLKSFQKLEMRKATNVTR